MSELSCPKCGFEREPMAAECPVCGILFARYRGEETRPPVKDQTSLGAFESDWGSEASQVSPSQTAASVPGPATMYEGGLGPGAFEPQSFDGAPLEMPGLRDANPYAAPRALVVDNASLADTGELARRGTRLAARLLDLLIIFCTVMVAVMPAAMMSDPSSAASMAWMGFAGLAMLGLLVYNLVLLAQEGQTLGKKALKIRIVRNDGDRVGLGRLIGLRWLPITLLGAVPIVGPIFGLANALFIFREDQRCLHDHFADTKVVLA